MKQIWVCVFTLVYEEPYKNIEEDAHYMDCGGKRHGKQPNIYIK